MWAFCVSQSRWSFCLQAAQAIRKLNEAGWLVILATNQPVLARGEVSEEELTEIHNKMETLLGKEGVRMWMQSIIVRTTLTRALERATGV